MGKKYFIYIFILATCMTAGAQAYRDDLALLRGPAESHGHGCTHQSEIRFALLRDRGLVSWINPVNVTLSAMMHVYKKHISPQISADCLYHPSCSEYSRQLFRKYGSFKAFFCTADRLSRCNRISATSIGPLDINPNDFKVHENIEYYQINP